MPRAMTLSLFSRFRLKEHGVVLVLRLPSQHLVGVYLLLLPLAAPQVDLRVST